MSSGQYRRMWIGVLDRGRIWVWGGSRGWGGGFTGDSLSAANQYRKRSF